MLRPLRFEELKASAGVNDEVHLALAVAPEEDLPRAARAGLTLS
jgi:hypothetical protein